MLHTVPLLCVLLLSSFVYAAVSSSSGTTNAEQFRRGLPPLPPANVPSMHKRHVRPTSLHVARDPCPSPTPGSAYYTCTGSCGVISVSTTASPPVLLGYLSAGGTHNFYYTACASAASVFTLPGDTSGMFSIQQAAPADVAYPYLGAGLGEYGDLGPSSDASSVMCSTTQDDIFAGASPLPPNANADYGYTDDAESTIWYFADPVAPSEILAAWTTPTFTQVNLVVVGDIGGALSVTGSATLFIASQSEGTVEEMTLAWVPIS